MAIGAAEPCSRRPRRVSHRALIHDDGLPESVPAALQHRVQDLPNDVLLFLLASRYCEVDSELRDTAWSLFGHLPAGWSLVQAVCDYVHQHIRFDYMQARANRTALEVYRERIGVCRDYMHLADHVLPLASTSRPDTAPVTWATSASRASPDPMDFSAWFEVYLGGAVARVRRPQQRPRASAESSWPAAATPPTWR